MKAQTKPPTREAARVIGREHLRPGSRRSGSPRVVRVQAVARSRRCGLPQVTEVAFAVLERRTRPVGSSTGVNWSAALVNPFRQLGRDSLDTILQTGASAATQPIVLLIHVAHPRVAVRRPWQVNGGGAMRATPILSALDGVGKKWTRQIKAEERSSEPHAATAAVDVAQPRARSLKEICYEHMEEAWNKAPGGRLPTHWRQVFYVMRPICDADPSPTGRCVDRRSRASSSVTWSDYEPGWDVLRGARGVFKEPHAASDDNGLAMSTMNVRNYLRARQPGSRWSASRRGFRRRRAKTGSRPC